VKGKKDKDNSDGGGRQGKKTKDKPDFAKRKSRKKKNTKTRQKAGKTGRTQRRRFMSYGALYSGQPCVDVQFAYIKGLLLLLLLLCPVQNNKVEAPLLASCCHALGHPLRL
jgi:hypothetical protein